jgi:enoyl-CoA hydratase/carnithine racemase
MEEKQLLHPRPDLDLKITGSGDLARPLVILDLDASTDHATRGAGLRRAIPLTIGVLRGPPAPELAPVLDALTLTLTMTELPAGARQLVHVTDLGNAVSRLEAAVSRSPRAAVACGHLLRQNAQTSQTIPALAAEAAVFSMLLGGPDFARWLAERGDRPAPRPPDRPLVRISRSGNELEITLDHPQRRNALSARLREEFLAAVEVAAADPGITRVTITGTGPGFCSGGDLAEFGLARDPSAAYLVRLARAPWRVIDEIADRVTMRVHGACAGAGAEIAAFGGQVIAAPDTFFSFPEVSMGLVPGAGGTVSVPQRIGRWRAAWLFLTGERVSAEAALRWGLVDALC